MLKPIRNTFLLFVVAQAVCYCGAGQAFIARVAGRRRRPLHIKIKKILGGQQLSGVLARGCGYLKAAEHTRNFFDALGAGQLRDP